MHSARKQELYHAPATTTLRIWRTIGQSATSQTEPSPPSSSWARHSSCFVASHGCPKLGEYGANPNGGVLCLGLLGAERVTWNGKGTEKESSSEEMICHVAVSCDVQLKASAFRRGNDILLVLYLCFDISLQFKAMTGPIISGPCAHDHFITAKSCVEADNLNWHSSAS